MRLKLINQPNTELPARTRGKVIERGFKYQ